MRNLVRQPIAMSTWDGQRAVEQAERRRRISVLIEQQHHGLALHTLEYKHAVPEMFTGSPVSLVNGIFKNASINRSRMP